jgi:hypothetical protein
MEDIKILNGSLEHNITYNIFIIFSFSKTFLGSTMDFVFFIAIL